MTRAFNDTDEHCCRFQHIARLYKATGLLWAVIWIGRSAVMLIVKLMQELNWAHRWRTLLSNKHRNQNLQDRPCAVGSRPEFVDLRPVFFVRPKCNTVGPHHPSPLKSQPAIELQPRWTAVTEWTWWPQQSLVTAICHLTSRPTVWRR